MAGQLFEAAQPSGQESQSHSSGAWFSIIGLAALPNSLLAAPKKVELNRSFSSRTPVTMTETDVKKFRNVAEQCRKLAEEARSQADKEAWLRLAADWIKLAENPQ